MLTALVSALHALVSLITSPLIFDAQHNSSLVLVLLGSGGTLSSATLNPQPWSLIFIWAPLSSWQLLNSLSTLFRIYPGFIYSCRVQMIFFTSCSCSTTPHLALHINVFNRTGFEFHKDLSTTFMLCLRNEFSFYVLENILHKPMTRWFIQNGD